MQIANTFFAVRQGGKLELLCGKADFRHERYPRRIFFFFFCKLLHKPQNGESLWS